MPIYTYRCEDCGVQFERNQKFSDAPLTRCPECGKKSLRKVYTPVGIVFKGSGFYSTDHRSPSGGRSGSSHEDKAGSSDSSKPAESEANTSKSGSAEQGSAEKAAPAKGTTSASSKAE